LQRPRPPIAASLRHRGRSRATQVPSVTEPSPEFCGITPGRVGPTANSTIIPDRATVVIPLTGLSSGCHRGPQPSNWAWGLMAFPGMLPRFMRGKQDGGDSGKAGREPPVRRH
jgi:hypothetical protein